MNHVRRICLCGIITFLICTIALLLHHTCHAGWDPVTYPTINQDWGLSGVHFVSADEGWAVGGTDSGIILHYKNGTWSSEPLPYVSSLWTLFQVHFTSSSEGWAVGSDPVNGRGVLLHFLNGAWASIAPPSVSPKWLLNGVHFISAAEGWAVGNDVENSKGVLLHYSNGTWTSVTPPAGAQQFTGRIFFLSSNEGWAVGSGKLFHYSNGMWNSITLPTVSSDWAPFAVHFTSTDEGWVVGIDNVSKSGVLIHFTGGTWSVVTPPAISSNWVLWDVQFTTPSDGWAVGADVQDPQNHKGVLLHYSNGIWSSVAPPTFDSGWQIETLSFTSLYSGWAVGRQKASNSVPKIHPVIIHYTESSLPVLLVHGYGGASYDCWGDMGNLLNKDGFNVYLWDYNFTASSSWTIEDIAKQLSIKVNNLLVQTGAPQIDILAHSMGGLVTRAWMAGLESSGSVPYVNQIRRLIMAGTPNYGSVWAGFPLTMWSEVQQKQLSFGSLFIWNLNNRWNQLGLTPDRLSKTLTIAGTQNLLGYSADDDGVVNVSSVGLYGIEQRYVPYSHYRFPGSTLSSFLVDVEINDNKHKTYKIIKTFLNTGIPPSQTEIDNWDPTSSSPSLSEGMFLIRMYDNYSRPITTLDSQKVYLEWTPKSGWPIEITTNHYNSETGCITVQNLDQGEYTLKVLGSILGYQDRSYDVTITTAKTAILRADLSPPPPPPPPPSSGGSGGCFIATAAFGSYMEPHVMILREFRDRVLLESIFGQKFVSFYYEVSPPIATYISQHECLKMIFRWMLVPVICVSWTALQIGSIATLILTIFIMTILSAATYNILRKRSQIRRRN